MVSLSLMVVLIVEHHREGFIGWVTSDFRRISKNPNGGQGEDAIETNIYVHTFYISKIYLVFVLCLFFRCNIWRVFSYRFKCSLKICSFNPLQRTNTKSLGNLIRSRCYISGDKIIRDISGDIIIIRSSSMLLWWLN